MNPFKAPFQWNEFKHYRNGKLVQRIISPNIVDGIIPKPKSNNSSLTTQESIESTVLRRFALQKKKAATTSFRPTVTVPRVESSNISQVLGKPQMKARLA